jgi:hypothetical protein
MRCFLTVFPVAYITGYLPAVGAGPLYVETAPLDVVGLLELLRGPLIQIVAGLASWALARLLDRYGKHTPPPPPAATAAVLVQQ